ncbi:MAG: flagellar biosynthesis anti-sigma factor FlgM [Immundisolibacter sp.]|uniref:flagellar biosynthesis anti-sigma factor FlgM n=1 Tax=Immundisolibacter sp. TaxID=1934948 RepID=UPI003D12C497
MEIKSTSHTPDVARIDTGAARAEPQLRSPSGEVPANGDSVKLTDSARQLNDLQGAVAATPAVNADRVAALREAIANGTYVIDPQRIADGLLAQDRAALG